MPARSKSTPTPTPSPPQEPTIHPIFEPITGTFQYLMADPHTQTAAIIDPVLDYDLTTHAITTTSADHILALAQHHNYHIAWILETHAHADHLTAASYLQKRLERQQNGRPKIGIGKRIGMVQQRFAKRYGVPEAECEAVFDKLFDDDESFELGEVQVKAVHLPGHTPDHLGYMVGKNVFSGDSLFPPDIGTARCDFPGGSTRALWRSAQKLLALSDDVKIWMGHDYPPEGREEPVPWVSVAQHRAVNRHVGRGVGEEEFVHMRRERDAVLKAPRLLHQSLQVNIRGGRLPGTNEAGVRLLGLPLKVEGEGW